MRCIRIYILLYILPIMLVMLYIVLGGKSPNLRFYYVFA